MMETARMADVDHIVIFAVENEDRRLGVRHVVNGTAMSIPGVFSVFVTRPWRLPRAMVLQACWLA
jgi:hypothetical protein